MNIRSTIALVLVLVGLTVTAAACSASVSTGSSATPGGSQTYTNDQYRFSLTYDTLLTEGTSSGGTESGSGSVFDIAFADTSGTQIAGKYIDGIQVSVYELARSVKPAEVAGLKTEFKNLVTELMGSLGEAEATTPLSLTEINGVPGFTFSYSYTEDSVPITATTYFLIKGKMEYQVTAQASQEAWAELEPTLQAAVDSFTVK